MASRYVHTIYVCRASRWWFLTGAAPLRQTSVSPSVVRAAAPAVFVASVVSFLFSNMILGGGETFTIKRDIISILRCAVKLIDIERKIRN